MILLRTDRNYSWNFTKILSLNGLLGILTILLNYLTLCLPVTSAVNLGKQFGPRSGPTNRRAWSGSKLFDILMVFLKEFFQKVNFEKNRQTTKRCEKLPSMQWVKNYHKDPEFSDRLVWKNSADPNQTALEEQSMFAIPSASFWQNTLRFGLFVWI